MQRFDLVIVGGGIAGLGVARLAARNGLAVAVVERGDLAGGASSATSHMLHGGLRYLEHGHFALVREALAERAAVTRMAPMAARPTRFLIPFYRGDRRPPWILRAGLAAYDLFAGRGRLAPHAVVRAREARALEPDLEPAGLTGAGLYSDVVMDDAALAVAVARDAAAHGAQIATYTEVVGARPAENGTVEVIARDRLSGGELAYGARVLVNATGPWTDRTRAMLLRALRPGAADPPPLLRPSRGIHLVYPQLTRGHALVTFAPGDGRVCFVVPFGAHTLVGTTEVEVSSPPPDDAWTADPAEVAYLRGVVARLLPAAADTPPLAITTGLRPLLAAAGTVAAASREHGIIDDGALVTVAGGKFTTFRVMARDLLEVALRKFPGPPRVVRDPVSPLPAPPGGDGGAEGLVEYAVERAFARRLEDVVRRRSGLWLTPDRGRVAAPVLAAAMARRLGWSAERAREEVHAFHAALEREERLLEARRSAA